MASAEQNVTARLPWTRRRNQIALLVGLVTALAVAVISLNTQTVPVRRSRVGTSSAASVALPCRHQMTLSRQAPACAATSPADMTPGYMASRRAHAVERGRPSRDDCLGLPRRGCSKLTR
jgi:hypothetical protein